MFNISASEFIKFSENVVLIDARSPSEYKKSHLKKALNFYALSDIEHESVGLKYTKNKFNAKLLGASFVCKNMSSHLKKIEKFCNPYTDKVLIYCARGGQRSGSMGHILSEIGFEVYKCEGGFKALRNYYIDFFENYKNDNFVSLAGNTACGKSRLLHILDNKIDLERLARHFGSTFGSRGFSQPSQQQFDINLYYELQKLNINKKIYIEAESKNIGKITLSNSFYKAMNSGLIILCEASLETRIRNCVEDYKGISKEFFYDCLARLKKYLGNAICEDLANSFNKNDYENVAKILLVDYYDKVYKKPSRYDFKLNLDDLERAKSELTKYTK